VIEFYFPIDWDGDAEEFTLGFDVDFWVGGNQHAYFNTEYITFALDLAIYPLWLTLMSNNFYIEVNEWEHCDHMYRGYEIMQATLDFTVGNKHCASSVYNAFINDVNTNYACDFEESELNLVTRTYGNWNYEQFGYDSCDREIVMEEPEDYFSDDLNDTVFDEEAGDREDITDEEE